MELKTKITAIISRLCAATLTLLGFSCSENSEVMYGTPYGTFEVKGTVTGEKGEAIPDATVRVASTHIWSGVYSYGQAVTNSDGEYVVASQSFPTDSLKIVCIPVSKTYMPDSITVPVHYDRKKHDSWYEGHAELTANFHLKPSAQE